MAAATYRHRHAVRTGDQAYLHSIGATARKATRTAQITNEFNAAVQAAAGRTTTVADAAQRLRITEKTVKALVRAGRMEGVRDADGRITGIVESSIRTYRNSRAAGRAKFRACQFKTAAAYAAQAASRAA